MMISSEYTLVFIVLSNLVIGWKRLQPFCYGTVFSDR